jgi:uroporphyrinogen-III synthase
MPQPSGPAVVLTREADDNRELTAALQQRGVPVREIPCLATRYVEPASTSADADALAFGSRRGVRGFVRALSRSLGKGPSDGAARGGPMIGAVGGATAAELRKHGIAADVVADPPEGRVLARLLDAALPRGARVIVVRGNLGTAHLESDLAEAGHRVQAAVVYENVAPEIPEMDPFPVAAVFVASPSAARRLIHALPWMADERFCAIGPTTGQALEGLGVRRVQRVGIQLADQAEALSTAYRRAIDDQETP